MENGDKQDLIRFAQEKLLILMDYFHGICEKENINYSLAYGTMLGAVRHKGFIPWDDDADVFMLRGEYERFVEAVKKYPRDDLYFREHYYWIKKIAFTNPPDFNGRKIIGDEIHLDIFIFDELPKTEKERKKLYFKLHKYQGMLSVEPIFGKGRPLKDKLLMLGTRLMGKFHRRKALCAKYDKASQKYHGTDAADLYNSNNSFIGIKRAYKKDWLAQTESCPFEGREYKIFAAYDEILTFQFGDYMTPPPEGERKSHISLG